MTRAATRRSDSTRRGSFARPSYGLKPTDGSPEAFAVNGWRIPRVDVSGCATAGVAQRRSAGCSRVVALSGARLDTAHLNGRSNTQMEPSRLTICAIMAPRRAAHLQRWTDRGRIKSHSASRSNNRTISDVPVRSRVLPNRIGLLRGVGCVQHRGVGLEAFRGLEQRRGIWESLRESGLSRPASLLRSSSPFRGGLAHRAALRVYSERRRSRVRFDRRSAPSTGRPTPRWSRRAHRPVLRCHHGARLSAGR